MKTIEGEEGDEDFTKKKTTEEDFNKKTIEEGEEDFKKKKKKKTGEEDECEDSQLYTYVSLIERIFEEYMASKQKVSKLKIDELNITRDGAKKTVFVNLSRICKQINRDIDNVVLYIKLS